MPSAARKAGDKTIHNIFANMPVYINNAEAQISRVKGMCPSLFCLHRNFNITVSEEPSALCSILLMAWDLFPRTPGATLVFVRSRLKELRLFSPVRGKCR